MLRPTGLQAPLLLLPLHICAPPLPSGPRWGSGPQNTHLSLVLCLPAPQGGARSGWGLSVAPKVARIRFGTGAAPRRWLGGFSLHSPLTHTGNNTGSPDTARPMRRRRAARAKGRSARRQQQQRILAGQGGKETRAHGACARARSTPPPPIPYPAAEMFSRTLPLARAPLKRQRQSRICPSPCLGKRIEQINRAYSQC